MDAEVGLRGVGILSACWEARFAVRGGKHAVGSLSSRDNSMMTWENTEPGTTSG
mgnify:CR=1 FL=1